MENLKQIILRGIKARRKLIDKKLSKCDLSGIDQLMIDLEYWLSKSNCDYCAMIVKFGDAIEKMLPPNSKKRFRNEVKLLDIIK